MADILQMAFWQQTNFTENIWRNIMHRSYHGELSPIV